MENFRDSLLKSLEDNYQAFATTLPKLIVGLIVLLLFWLISKYVLRIIENSLKEKLEDQLVLRFIIKTSRLILMGIAIISFLNVVGLGGVAAGLWGTAGLGAFILGFAFKDIGEHFLAGFILAFNRPFNIGDTVEIIGHLGSVVGLTLRNTHIKTFDGKDVYIPNGEVIKSPLINYTIDGFIRKDFVVSITFQADQEEAVSLLSEVMTQHTGVLKGDKAPYVFINALHSKAIELKCMYWLNTLDNTVSPGQVELDLVSKGIEAMEQNGMLYQANTFEIKSIKEE